MAHTSLFGPIGHRSPTELLTPTARARFWARLPGTLPAHCRPQQRELRADAVHFLLLTYPRLAVW